MMIMKVLKKTKKKNNDKLLMNTKLNRVLDHAVTN